MELRNEELMYEFYAKDLSQPEALKQFSDHAVKEIKSLYGWDTEISVKIESESQDKHLFLVSMCVFGLGEKIIVKKQGKHPMPLLRKVRKTVMRQIHRLSEKRANYRRRAPIKDKLNMKDRHQKVYHLDVAV